MAKDTKAKPTRPLDLKHDYVVSPHGSETCVCGRTQNDPIHKGK
jgi:hypothetical protein